MSKTTADTDLMTPVTLVVGPEELLAERAVAEVVAAVRAVDPDADVRDLAPGTLEPGMLTELTSPSLFGERKVIVIRGVQDLPAPVLSELTAYVRRRADDVALLCLHKGGTKAKPLLDAARGAGARQVDCAELKRFADKLAFVKAEARRAGRRISDEGARTLIDAVGSDLRELVNACSQLVADTTGTIDEEVVRRYYAGRAEVTSFMVADLAVEGRTAEALASLRWALGSGVDPVLVTSALAMGLRNIARLASAPRGLRPGDLARELAMPPWKVDRVRHQVRGWTADGVADAIRAVAEADAAVKGGGDSPAYALERAVVAIVSARDGGRRPAR
jgi:DNA polymerase III delta subunit